MSIVAARKTEIGTTIFTLDSGQEWSFDGDLPEGKYRERFREWLDSGGVIAPYVAPPPPTNAERVDNAWNLSDREQVIFKMLFELANEVRVLKGQATITTAQFKTYLETKLP